MNFSYGSSVYDKVLYPHHWHESKPKYIHYEPLSPNKDMECTYQLIPLILKNFVWLPLHEIIIQHENKNL